MQTLAHFSLKASYEQARELNNNYDMTKFTFLWDIALQGVTIINFPFVFTSLSFFLLVQNIGGKKKVISKKLNGKDQNNKLKLREWGEQAPILALLLTTLLNQTVP